MNINNGDVQNSRNCCIKSLKKKEKTIIIRWNLSNVNNERRRGRRAAGL